MPPVDTKDASAEGKVDAAETPSDRLARFAGTLFEEDIPAEAVIGEDRLTVEEVRSAMNVWLDTADLPPAWQRKRFQQELEKQQYYQQRNKRARVSHTKTRVALLAGLGIDVKRIKSCLPNTESP